MAVNDKKEKTDMSNKLVKKSNLGDLSYSDLGLDVSFQILEAPYLEDGTKMLFKIDDVENFCAYNLNDFADFGSILLLRQNDTFFFACIDKAKNDIAYINEKTHPQMYKEIGDIVFEMAMDTYGHYFSGIVVLVEVEPNTYKMIEKYFFKSTILFILLLLIGIVSGFYSAYKLIMKK